MRIAKLEKNSVANGPGLRVVLWVSGCRLHCKGCHNQSTWDFCSGQIFNTNMIQEICSELEKTQIKGITFSGGHPLEPENVIECCALTRYIKQKYPTKNIWLYTGLELTADDILNGERWKNIELHKWYKDLLQLCDVIVDGPYIESERDITLKFRGSRNQRLIDVQKTLNSGKIQTLL
jgi:anaerobic ribonucleoside-triphosphate reductase activating protein